MDIKKLRFWDKKSKSYDDELHKLMANQQKRFDDERQRMQKAMDNLQKLTDVVDELKRKRDSEEITQEEFRQRVNEATGMKTK